MRRWTWRAARVSDAPTIARHRYYAEGTQDDIDVYADWIALRLDRGTYVGFIAESSERVIAGAGAAVLDWGPGRAGSGHLRARVTNVYTDEGWRRQGIARALLGEVLRACDALGVHTYNLGASADGKSIYTSLGFTRVPGEMILRR